MMYGHFRCKDRQTSSLKDLSSSPPHSVGPSSLSAAMSHRKKRTPHFPHCTVLGMRGQDFPSRRLFFVAVASIYGLIQMHRKSLTDRSHDGTNGQEKPIFLWGMSILLYPFLPFPARPSFSFLFSPAVPGCLFG